MATIIDTEETHHRHSVFRRRQSRRCFAACCSSKGAFVAEDHGNFIAMAIFIVFAGTLAQNPS